VSAALACVSIQAALAPCHATQISRFYPRVPGICDFIEIIEIKWYVWVMASLTIRNLDDGVKERLRVRAAQHGRSMEEEARLILNQAVGGLTAAGLLSLSRQLFGNGQGIDLDLPARTDRPAPDFSRDD
jgi:antitoxin FitA